MSPLERLIAAEIAQAGPMPVSRFWTLALQHPEHGYYTTRDPFGAEGDFITAPEISQMFGEMIALWLGQVWMDQGRPGATTLMELGPGRGTLMADVLRTARAVPGLVEALRPVFVETSPSLRAIQAAAVPGARWLDHVSEFAAEGPLFVIANEFFDALPIRQFQREGHGWRERVVGLDGERLVVGLAPVVAAERFDSLFPSAGEDEIVEIRDVDAHIGPIAASIGEHGGAALIIDYGAWDGTGDTLQALKAHKPVDPLEAPGSADITSHVNFSHIAAAAPGLRAQFDGQGAFLERLGITARARALARDPGPAARIAAQHRRLTHPGEMGTLFKVLALSPRVHPPTPGFEETA